MLVLPEVRVVAAESLQWCIGGLLGHATDSDWTASNAGMS